MEGRERLGSAVSLNQIQQNTPLISYNITLQDDIGGIYPIKITFFLKNKYIYSYLSTLMTLLKSPISKTCSGWQMAKYRSTLNETIVSTEEYEALKQKWRQLIKGQRVRNAKVQST